MVSLGSHIVCVIGLNGITLQGICWYFVHHNLYFFLVWDSSKVILNKSKTESEKTIHCWKITFPPLSRPIWEIQQLESSDCWTVKSC